jgi:hypothetical protein
MLKLEYENLLFLFNVNLTRCDVKLRRRSSTNCIKMRKFEIWPSNWFCQKKKGFNEKHNNMIISHVRSARLHLVHINNDFLIAFRTLNSHHKSRKRSLGILMICN